MRGVDRCNDTFAALNRLYADLSADGNKKVPGGLSAKTVRYIHTIVHKCLADAIDTGLVTMNAAERAKPSRPKVHLASEIGFWEPRKLRVFLDSVRGHRLEAAWHVAAMTGMRREEVLGLRWKDISIDDTRISARQAFVAVAYEIITSTLKNHHARVTDLGQETIGQLQTHQRRQQVDRDEWSTDYQDNDLVFCMEDGTPIHPQTFSQAFERLVAKMDLPTIRLHDFRHTHATSDTQGRRPRQGHHGTPRPREPSVYYEAVRPCAPRYADGSSSRHGDNRSEFNLTAGVLSGGPPSGVGRVTDSSCRPG